jgi:hypothetical protein
MAAAGIFFDAVLGIGKGGARTDCKHWRCFGSYSQPGSGGSTVAAVEESGDQDYDQPTGNCQYEGSQGFKHSVPMLSEGVVLEGIL